MIRIMSSGGRKLKPGQGKRKKKKKGKKRIRGEKNRQPFLFEMRSI